MSLNVLIVCSGNICRSPMAEGLLKKLLLEKGMNKDVSVCSAGMLGITGSAASRNGIIACRTEFQVDISEHSSQGVTEELLQNADIVLCMEQNHIKDISWRYPGYESKCHLLKKYAGMQGDYLDVEDPVGKDLDKHTKICREIESLLQNSMNNIIFAALNKHDTKLMLV